jgi:hypothetical protein
VSIRYRAYSVPFFIKIIGKPTVATGAKVSEASNLTFGFPELFSGLELRQLYRL